MALTQAALGVSNAWHAIAGVPAIPAHQCQFCAKTGGSGAETEPGKGISTVSDLLALLRRHRGESSGVDDFLRPSCELPARSPTIYRQRGSSRATRPRRAALIEAPPSEEKAFGAFKRCARCGGPVTVLRACLLWKGLPKAGLEDAQGVVESNRRWPVMIAVAGRSATGSARRPEQKPRVGGLVPGGQLRFCAAVTVRAVRATRTRE